jgi:hypothetical protein
LKWAKGRLLEQIKIDSVSADQIGQERLQAEERGWMALPWRVK